MNMSAIAEKWLGRNEENRKAFAAFGQEAVEKKLSIEKKAEEGKDDSMKRLSTLAGARETIGRKAGYPILGIIDEAFRSWARESGNPGMITRLSSIVIECLAGALEEEKEESPENDSYLKQPVLRTADYYENFFRSFCYKPKAGIEFRIEDLSLLGKALLEAEGSPTENMVADTEQTEKELAEYYGRYLRDSDTTEDEEDDPYVAIALRYGKPAAGMALYAANAKHGDEYGLWIDALFSVLAEGADAE